MEPSEKGGAVGVLIQGFKRPAFSNEAGIGSVERDRRRRGSAHRALHQELALGGDRQGVADAGQREHAVLHARLRRQRLDRRGIGHAHHEVRIAHGHAVGHVGVGAQTVGQRMLGRITRQLLTEAGVLAVAGGALGVATGGILPVWNAIVPVLFGLKNFGRAMGLMAPVVSLVGAPTFLVIGLVRDSAGSYVPVFQGFLGVLTVSLLVILPLKVVRGGDLKAA